MNILESLSPIEILGLTILGEARGEPIEGQIAVGSVIRNRLQKGKFKSYYEVCLEPYQFSCWNHNDPNYSFLNDLAKSLISGHAPTDPLVRQAFFIANGIISWQLLDNVQGARNYMTESLFNSDKRPNWAKNVTFTIKKGHHLFFSV